MAPLIVEFGWEMNDWNMLGRGTLVSHLLECAGQVTALLRTFSLMMRTSDIAPTAFGWRDGSEFRLTII